MTQGRAQFSFAARQKALQRFRDETFDLLIIGGGITGAAVARDAVSRGLKVALVERRDFAFGTSSRSSKLIHGGLRYLQNMEFGLVFEALAERALLLKTAPYRVRPLPFYLPVYQKDPKGMGLLTLGLWLYDLLTLFRTPGFHKRLSRRKMAAEIPFLKSEGLVGGFRYFDASMWDDVLAVDTLRSAQEGGAAVANYVEAVAPVWDGDKITGFRVRDCESSAEAWVLRAHRTVVCAGPWTDEVGARMGKDWNPWLNPSKGVHLVFDLNRIPVPGAMVMSHPEDHRISFVIPRPDFGAGVVIVGTTDGPTPADPEKAEVSSEDVAYLMGLLNRYFPDLKLTSRDILSAYVGVRPLMGENLSGSEGQEVSLQKVSREHHIDRGPGGVVVVAGGKYTTHRKMAEEIVDFTLKLWSETGGEGMPSRVGPSQTQAPVNPYATPAAIEKAIATGREVPQELIDRYGADAVRVMELGKASEDPAGFPLLSAQLRYSIRYEMVLHLEDFFLRRVPLFMSRKDHGLPWVDGLAQVWAEETGKSPDAIPGEITRLKEEILKRTVWEKSLSPSISFS